LIPEDFELKHSLSSTIYILSSGFCSRRHICSMHVVVSNNEVGYGG